MADKQTVEDLVDELLPLAVPNYNMGLLPDEPGYNNEFAEMRYHSEQKREYFKAQLNQLLIKERIKEVKHLACYEDKQLGGYIDLDIGEVNDRITNLENQLGEKS